MFAFKMRLKFDDFFSMGFLTMVNNDEKQSRSFFLSLHKYVGMYYLLSVLRIHLFPSFSFLQVRQT